MKKSRFTDSRVESPRRAVLRTATVQVSTGGRTECHLADAYRELACRSRPAPDAAKRPTARSLVQLADSIRTALTTSMGYTAQQ